MLRASLYRIAVHDSRLPPSHRKVASLSKCYPSSILVSCEVPWDENHELIEDTFRAKIRDTMETYNNLYIFGTMGEGYAIILSRFKEIFRIFREETDKPDVHPMVGIISMSTGLVVEKISTAYYGGISTCRSAGSRTEPYGAGVGSGVGVGGGTSRFVRVCSTKSLPPKGATSA